MIMVYADLDVCIDRVNNRSRTYNKNITIDSWYAVYNNIVLYKKVFKNKFFVVQTDITESLEKYIYKLFE